MDESKCKDCRNCLRSGNARRMGLRNYWTCLEERFNPGQKVLIAYAWSGICRPNKAVAAAQKDCPFFTRRLWSVTELKEEKEDGAK
jgi:hypothetical protein